MLGLRHLVQHRMAAALATTASTKEASVLGRCSLMDVADRSEPTVVIVVLAHRQTTHLVEAVVEGSVEKVDLRIVLVVEDSEGRVVSAPSKAKAASGIRALLLEAVEVQAEALVERECNSKEASVAQVEVSAAKAEASAVKVFQMEDLAKVAWETKVGQGQEVSVALWEVAPWVGIWEVCLGRVVLVVVVVAALVIRAALSARVHLNQASVVKEGATWACPEKEVSVAQAALVTRAILLVARVHLNQALVVRAATVDKGTSVDRVATAEALVDNVEKVGALVAKEALAKAVGNLFWKDAGFVDTMFSVNPRLCGAIFAAATHVFLRVKLHSERVNLDSAHYHCETTSDSAKISVSAMI